MKKLKLYLDTSVISHLFAEDTPDKMRDTNKLWADLISGKYEVFISETVVTEMQKCTESKFSQMTNKLNEVDFSVLEATSEVNQLATAYIENDVLTPKSLDDCIHIAFAVVANCDMIVSWNFKHLVNIKTINKVKIVNAINHYKEIGIYSPTMLLEGDDEI